MGEKFSPRQFNDAVFKLFMQVLESGKEKSMIYATPNKNYKITIAEISVELQGKPLPLPIDGDAEGIGG